MAAPRFSFPKPHMQDNQNIKAVVFDLGKVLVDFDYGIAVRRLAARARMTVQEFAQFVSHAPLLLNYESGRLSSHEFYTEVCNATGFCGSIDEFAVSFGDIFTAIEPMIELQQALRQRGLPTYIFSNTNELAIRHIRKTFPFFDGFNGYILSYEQGSMKPEARLYEVLERESGFTGRQILYLDDRAENVEAGAARGWQVILHQDPVRSAARVRELGLLRNHQIG
jgi:FMN phosphatase YigB (HAD superfamily)